MSRNENLIDILARLYKRRRRILLGTFIVAVVAALLSLLLDNYYKAHTLFYAASPDLAQPVSSLEQKFYGTDSDLDRLFSIAQSSEVKSFLIDSFDLYKHYEITPGKTKSREKLLLKLEKLYQTSKTKYDAIDLNVEDTDPDIAASMANAARDKINEIARKLLQKSQEAVINSLKESITIKAEEYEALTDSLYLLRKRHKIFNAESQGEAFGTNMVSLEGKVQNLSAQIDMLERLRGPVDSINVLRARLSGSQKQLQMMREDIEDYNEGYPALVNIEMERKDFSSQILFDKERLSKLEAAYNADIKAIHVIQEAESPVMKSRPKRSVIVIGVAFISFVLLSLFVILQDEYEKNNWKEAFRNA